MDFDYDDFEDTVQQIEARLSEENLTSELLKELIALMRQREQEWQARFAHLEDEQTALHKGLTFLANVQDKHRRRVGALAKSLARVAPQTPLTKSRTALVTGDVRRMPSPSLEDEVKRGVLAKTVLTLFGRHGGHSVPYNAQLASTMLLSGTLTPRQHATWKRSGRVHDDAWQHMQRRVG